nr:unnamed protein product [Digitaria exilis]
MPGAATLRSRAAVAAAACLAVLAAAALLHRRRRRNRAPASPRRLGAGGRRGRPRRACEEEEKPQARFKRVLADNSYSPFKHLRRQVAQPGGAEGEAPPLPSQESSERVHPFEDEITSLLNNPPDFHNSTLGDQCPEMNTSYNWVDTEAQLEHLARLLTEEKAFAVDTEQHSVRSFLGYTALMQISTQKEDYLIDTIALHDAMGILRPVFANPSICKIFHGADNDVLWLQRDFHIYVVNMFDTAKACEILSKPQKSLAYLLEVYCGVTTDKTMQVSSYSSSDRLNFFFEARHRSNMVCMQLYAKEIECPPGASSATSILTRNLQTHGLDSKRSSEVKDLVWKFCAWRDLMARMHDESLRYVLSDQAIAALSISLPKGSTEVFTVIADTDIVKSYYGGRDVTPEDLEMALLVGMSPHERRRLEKKKGYSFKFQAQNIITKSSSNTISENSGHGSENNHALSEQFPENGTESKGQQEFDETQSLSQLEDLALSQGSLSLPVSTEDTTFDHDIVTHDTDAGQLENGVHSPANGHLDKDPSICNNSNQAISKNAEKISLLGHGHHGKQVVELLLSNGGEEAINQFCQKWRQIFVEAVHPRYLPSGWNINHSGRRDFGDFSVYKPAKSGAPTRAD